LIIFLVYEAVKKIAVRINNLRLGLGLERRVRGTKFSIRGRQDRNDNIKYNDNNKHYKIKIIIKMITIIKIKPVEKWLDPLLTACLNS
jgi:hypothetical protein